MLKSENSIFAIFIGIKKTFSHSMLLLTDQSIPENEPEFEDRKTVQKNICLSICLQNLVNLNQRRLN
jgi:hypothetical protein